MATFATQPEQARLPRAHGPQLVFLLLTTLFALGLGGSAYVVSRYQRFAAADQAVQEQWIRVRDAYQHRDELVPGLVGAAPEPSSPERARVTEAVLNARLHAWSKVVPAAGSEFTEARQREEALGAALTRWLATDPAGSARFEELRHQLTGAEATLAAERDRYDEVARRFNRTRAGFPRNVVADLFGTRFAKKPIFEVSESR